MDGGLAKLLALADDPELPCLVQRRGIVRDPDWDQFERHLAHAIYEPNNAIYLPEGIGPRRIKTHGITDIACLYAFIVEELLRAGHQDLAQGMPLFLRSLAEEFRERWPDFAVPFLDDAQGFNRLRHLLDQIHRTTPLRDDRYFDFFEAIESYLYEGDAWTDSPTWGTDSFAHVWEALCMNHVEMHPETYGSLLAMDRRECDWPAPAHMDRWNGSGRSEESFWIHKGFRSKLASALKWVNPGNEEVESGHREDCPARGTKRKVTGRGDCPDCRELRARKPLEPDAVLVSERVLPGNGLGKKKRLLRRCASEGPKKLIPKPSRRSAFRVRSKVVVVDAKYKHVYCKLVTRQDPDLPDREISILLNQDFEKQLRYEVALRRAIPCERVTHEFWVPASAGGTRRIVIPSCPWVALRPMPIERLLDEYLQRHGWKLLGSRLAPPGLASNPPRPVTQPG
ncbi:hypothetical protein METEAL_33380 [Mesoterricola silvestris]|uniref:Uncharacterized protein n=2 Tax=Mesoterricola silvestris TaxID=2927979 RepID=A0AA48K9N4_9BACT|nr:hypothetical protein METEAL_33380 [Mesoterricola silvestris]